MDWPSMHFLIKDLQTMQNSDDLSSSHSLSVVFYRRSNCDTRRQGELTSKPEHIEGWAPVLTKARRESLLLLLLQVLPLCSSVSFLLFPTPAPLPFAVCWRTKQSPTPAYTSLSFCSFSPWSSTNPTWMLSANILNCPCTVSRTKGGLFLFCFPHFF